MQEHPEVVKVGICAHKTTRNVETFPAMHIFTINAQYLSVLSSVKIIIRFHLSTKDQPTTSKWLFLTHLSWGWISWAASFPFLAKRLDLLRVTWSSRVSHNLDWEWKNSEISICLVRNQLLTQDHSLEMKFTNSLAVTMTILVSITPISAKLVLDRPTILVDFCQETCQSEILANGDCYQKTLFDPDYLTGLSMDPKIEW